MPNTNVAIYCNQAIIFFIQAEDVPTTPIQPVKDEEEEEFFDDDDDKEQVFNPERSPLLPMILEINLHNLKPQDDAPMPSPTIGELMVK